MTYDFEFIGGDHSLDLVNTLMHRDQAAGADELLQSGEDVKRWFCRTGLLTELEAAGLDGEAALVSARRLRSALDALLRPIVRGTDDEVGTARGLAILNAVLDQSRERVQLVRTEGKFVRGTHLEILGPLDPSVHVARSAADLLHRLDPERLKECENPECDLLFYDESRNNSRRWCSMAGCGNVHKQAKFRQKSRAAATV